MNSKERGASSLKTVGLSNVSFTMSEDNWMRAPTLDMV